MTTTAPPATEARPATVSVTLRLDAVERLAARGGVTVAVSVDGEDVGVLADDLPDPVVETHRGAAIQLRYVAADGSSTDVVWEQAVDGTEITVVQPWRTPAADRTRVGLAWQVGGDRDRMLGQLDDAAPLTVTSPLVWFVSTEGGIVGSVDPGFVEAAHERGIDVWPAVQGLDADALHMLLSDQQRRSEAAAAIAADAAASGADGVNIDLEGFRSEDAAAVTAFVEEMSGLVHAWGGVVSYDLVPRTDVWDVEPADLAYWSTAPERRALAAAADYTVLMAYDQHNRFRPAGPVAAPAWVEQAVVYMLRYADPHTVVLGFPAYGRLWDPAALDSPRALSLGFFDGLAGDRTHDPRFGMDRIDLVDGTFYWADNEVEADRIAVGERYGLAGWAVWRLGLDDPGLWEELG